MNLSIFEGFSKRKLLKRKEMQTIVIVGWLTYSLSYITTTFLFRQYLRESNAEPNRSFDFSNRRYQVNTINIGVTLLAMAIIYFSCVS